MFLFTSSGSGFSDVFRLMMQNALILSNTLSSFLHRIIGLENN